MYRLEKTLTPTKSKLKGNSTYLFGYQGQYSEFDPETSLNHFELRQYGSRIGRWTATDPYRQYASPYTGMGNNPVSRVDPDGGFDWKWVSDFKAWLMPKRNLAESFYHEQEGEYVVMYMDKNGAWNYFKEGGAGWDLPYKTEAFVSIKYGLNKIDDSGTFGVSVDLGSLEIVKANMNSVDELLKGNLLTYEGGRSFTQGFRVETDVADVKFKLKYDIQLNLQSVEFGIGTMFTEIKVIYNHNGVHQLKIGSQEDVGKSINGVGVTASYFTGFVVDLNPKR